VSRPPFVATTLDGLERFPGDVTTVPIRAPFGIAAFGVNAYEADAGNAVIEEHDELGTGAGRHEELYVVLRGHARFTVAGAAGAIFEPSPWDAWLEALPSYTAGDYEQAIAIMGRALERFPDNPNVLYNLACFEALAGRRDDALAHLGRAADGEPRVREWASTDADLDPIRDDERFLA
jgi:tetratricopeptide (TPR) repeat protein